MSNSNLIKLIAFDNAIDANLLKLSLENEGIETFIFDENTVTIDPLISIAVGGIKVMVKESDVELAREVVKALDSEKYVLENDEVVACPNCKSDHVHKYTTMKSVNGLMVFIVSFLLFVYPAYKQNIFKCEDCGNEFDKTKL